MLNFYWLDSRHSSHDHRNHHDWSSFVWDGPKSHKCMGIRSHFEVL